MAKDPTKIADKWKRNAQSATESMKEGAAAVKEAPGLKAARKKEKYRQNTAASVDKWATNTAAVPLAEWQDDYVTLGIPRYGQGVERGYNAAQAFHEQHQPFVEAVKAKLDSMDDSTPEGRKAKMNANFDEQRKFKYTRRRR